MIKTTRTWVRPNLSVPWWNSTMTNEHIAYVNSKYVVTKKRLKSLLYASKDGLSLHSEMTFANKEAFEEFASDPIIRAWAKTRKDYCTKNDIIEHNIVLSEE